MIDYARRQKLIEARMKELFEAHQAAQTTMQQVQQEIFELRGALKLLQELAAEEASRRVHNGDLPGQEGQPHPDAMRIIDAPRPPS
jgi:hypothetical protein